MGTDIKRNKIGILGAFALSVGTGIGWGSFVVTGSNYLSKAGGACTDGGSFVFQKRAKRIHLDMFLRQIREIIR